MRILVLNGPNLNLLGVRAPEVYGSTTLDDLVTQTRAWAAELGVAHVEDFQSNHEGQLLDRLHAARGQVDGIVFNPGAFTHSSYALHDAIEAIEVPTVEVHISNVEEREPWRRISLVRPACVHTIYGRGVEGYRWAVRHLVSRSAWPVERVRYGDDPDAWLDVRLPDAPGPHPVVVLVHGGFWRHYWTFDTVESIAVDLARRGVAVAVPEYRRVGPVSRSEDDPPVWDAHLDVARAVSAVLSHDEIDGGRWAIAGHSAGGQLAIAALDALQHSDGGEVEPPRLVVSLAGVVDLPRAVEDDLGGGAAGRYVAGLADPVRVSPMHRLPLTAPLLVAHGRQDPSVPVAYSEAYAAAAADTGVDVESLITDGGHFEYLEPEDPAWTAVADRLVASVRS
ncbi:type II 3-dehydroquinate dehydratase [Euzebya tangerina]|uniref:type II 3-dehydroquinate dehydratase n=1 Tax=Euzebya tangerina TaxID=591198 RepID=UPI00196A5CD3|nr:type II 3-dehydroquinate dehydratase [Euzebya tangerina]